MLSSRDNCMMKVEGNTVCRVQSEAKKQQDHTINLDIPVFLFHIDFSWYLLWE